MVFDVRIDCLPLEESESLRYFREVIRGAHSDFQAGIPDVMPPVSFPLSWSEVGDTTKDLKHPNLMPARVRMLYDV